MTAAAESPAVFHSPIPSPETAEPVELTPQDRSHWSRWLQFLPTVLSLAIILVVIHELRGVDLPQLYALLPVSGAFWAVFVLRYVATPASEWLIFDRLWGVGQAAFGALLRKLVYNELLLGYVGEAYFYTWARRRVGLAAAPFGAVKDVAILGAIAGNLVTLWLLVAAWPFVRISQLGFEGRTLLLSLGLVLVISFGVLMLRRKIFTLPRAQLRMIFAVNVGRILVTTFLTALLWHLALPGIALSLWLVLSALRLLISRLPLVPNKDVIFAGVAVFLFGHDVEVATLMTLMAGLFLLAHVLVGTSFALSDLIERRLRA